MIKRKRFHAGENSDNRKSVNGDNAASRVIDTGVNVRASERIKW